LPGTLSVEAGSAVGLGTSVKRLPVFAVRSTQPFFVASETSLSK
jgi:hypothetical protein